jgi:hypothetical protein
MRGVGKRLWGPPAHPAARRTHSLEPARLGKPAARQKDGGCKVVGDEAAAAGERRSLVGLEGRAGERVAADPPTLDPGSSSQISHTGTSSPPPVHRPRYFFKPRPRPPEVLHSSSNSPPLSP